MIKLFDASTSLCCESKTKVGEQNEHGFDGIYVDGEVFINWMDILVSPPLSFSWRLIKDLCDEQYERTPNMTEAEIKNEGKYSEKYGPFSGKPQLMHSMFNGLMVLNIKYKIDKDNYLAISEILRELEKRIKQTLIVTNHNFEYLCRIRNNIRNIEIAATYNQTAVSLSEANYLFYDLSAKERFDKSIAIQSVNMQKKLETYIFDEISMEDIIKASVNFSEEQLMRLIDIVVKKRKNLLGISEMRDLIKIIMDKKLMQAKETLNAGKKAIVVLSNEYMASLPELEALGNRNLIVATKDPVLLKSI